VAHYLNVGFGNLTGMIFCVLRFIEMVLLDNLRFCQVKAKTKLRPVAIVSPVPFLNLHCAKLQLGNRPK
jgi:hypothetical protein